MLHYGHAAAPNDRVCFFPLLEALAGGAACSDSGLQVELQCKLCCLRMEGTGSDRDEIPFSVCPLAGRGACRAATEAPRQRSNAGPVMSKACQTGSCVGAEGLVGPQAVLWCWQCLGEGDMALLDMGAEYSCYGADITCSFPVGHAFSARAVPRTQLWQCAATTGKVPQLLRTGQSIGSRDSP